MCKLFTPAGARFYRLPYLKQNHTRGFIFSCGSKGQAVLDKAVV